MEYVWLLVIIGLISGGTALFIILYSKEPDMVAQRPAKSVQLVNKESSLPDTSLTVFAPNILTPVLQPTTENKEIKQLVEYYRPSRGTFTAWWQQGKAEARVALLEVLNREQVLVIEKGALLENAVREGKKSEVDFQVYVAQNAHVLLTIQHSAGQIEDAMRLKLSVENAGIYKLSKLLSDVKVEEHERLSKTNLENRWKEIVQDLDAADLLEISEQQLIKKLTQHLMEMRREQHHIANGDDPPKVKKAILQRYDKNIQSLEDKLDARQGLVSPENGKEISGYTEQPTDRRADRAKAGKKSAK